MIQLDQETQHAVNWLRQMMGTLNSDERKEVWDQIQEGYCAHCGMEDPHHRCQCWNDE